MCEKSWITLRVAKVGLTWHAVASSADGSKLVAVGNGGIYTAQSTPAPVLNLTPSSNNLVLSWTVPSTNFVLQENSDLATMNWVDAKSIPTLILTNLQNQVTVLPPSTGQTFYRLKNP